MKTYTIRFAILLVTLVLTQNIFADVKIKSRQTAGGQSSENTTYIKGKRMRSERGGSGSSSEMVSITQCDLKRSVTVMPQAQTYMINQWQTAANVAPTTTTKTTQTVTEKGGVVTTTYTTKDTGERKQMFGYTAKRLLTTMETVSSPDSCNPGKSRVETDGWYIEAAFALNCDYGGYGGYTGSDNGGGCQDRYEMKQIGKARTGYPVLETMTMYDENGKATFTTTDEVLEISNATLDAALFDIPAGYREAKNSTELYASMSRGAANSDDNNNSMNLPKSNSTPKNNAAVNNMNADVSATSGAIKSSSNPGEKKAGVVRIGIAHIKTGAVGEGINAQELAAAIKNTLGEYLDSPNVEMFQLDAKLPSAIEAEAKSIDCD